MYYSYILYSLSSDKYYVGYSNDYIRRLTEHNTTDKNTYISKHRPWVLKVVFKCSKIEAEAMAIEKFIKQQKSSKLIETMIAGNVLTGILVRLIRVPDVRD